MGAKEAFGVAISFTIISCIFFIVSVASNGWILGCTDVSIVKSMDDGEKANPSRHSVSNAGQGNRLHICLSKGIQKLSVSVSGIGFDIPMKMDMIAFGMIIGSIGIIVAILCSAAAAIALITAAASSADSCKRKRTALKRARVGVILLVITGVMGMAGMIACTVETVRDVNNISRVANQLETVMAEIMNKSFPGSTPDKVDHTSPVFYALSNIHASHSIILGWIAIVLYFNSIIASVVGMKILSSQPYTDLDAKENLLSQPYAVHEGSV